MPNLWQKIKAIAVLTVIAVASVAILVFGVFIGAVLLFLGAAFLISVVLYVAWLTYQEHRKEKG